MGVTSYDYVLEGLRDHYGLRGSLARLDGEYDLNFLLTDGNDNRFLVKVMRRDCDVGLVDMQCAALQHVAASGVTLPLAQVVFDSSSRAYCFISDASGYERILWVQQVLAGRSMHVVTPWTDALLRQLGACLGQFTAAMQGFDHAYSRRIGFKWDLVNAQWTAGQLGALNDELRRSQAVYWLSRFENTVVPMLSTLRRSVIHGDVNDCNVLLAWEGGRQKLTGLIDLGDMCHSITVGDLAIACAYGMMRSSDPIGSMAQIVSSFHEQFELTDEEISLVLPLAMTRLTVSVVNSSLAAQADPGNAYATLSQSAAFELLDRLHEVPERVAEIRLRLACGLEALPRWPAIQGWLESNQPLAALFPDRPQPEQYKIIDLSFESDRGGPDPTEFDCEYCESVIEIETESYALTGVGRYGEARPLYTSSGFRAAPNAQRRTHHLGIDLFVPAGTRVAVPLAGEVVLADVMPGHLDYGGIVVLRHQTDEGDEFYTLYGHLDPESFDALAVGQCLKAGASFAEIGEVAVNGGWPPHLHLQLLAELVPNFESPPGVSTQSDFAACSVLNPNPSVLLGQAPERFAWDPPAAGALGSRRDARFARNLRLSYSLPVAPVRGWRHHLYDVQGRCYLDAYNNVPHVGHSHPVVIEAVSRQWRLLNTNSRYLCRQLGDYADRLVELLPHELEVCFLVNSGSEANELALRLAGAATNAHDILVMAHGYHGWTTGAFSISPYKFEPAAQKRSWVHVTPQPDVFRGPFKANDPKAGLRYAERVAETVQELQCRNAPISAYISETLPSVGGQIVPPADFMSAVYAAVRAAGGVCIADDVQTGVGRLGSHFWGFELHDAVPDILVLGKPLGNGFPVGAVVTTREIASSFDNGVEYFSTFGGNTVACAAGMAVLDIMESENLQHNAQRVGTYVKRGLYQLQQQFSIIGDVRGHGLFLGVELVNDPETLLPAARQAEYIKNRMRECGVLLGLEGPHDNVVKIRPPMTFDEPAADQLLEVLGYVLAEDPALPDAPKALREHQNY